MITGTGFSKAGTASLILNGVNTYSGTTTINAGAVFLNNGSAASSGPIVINGTAGNQFPRLILNGTSMTLANNVTLSGTHGSSGAGTVQYDVASGTATISGTVRVGANNGIATGARFNFQNQNNNNSVFDLAGFNQSLFGLLRTGTTGNGGIYNTSTTSDSTLTLTGTSLFSGAITDFSSTSRKVNLVVSGGTHTITGTSSFTGTTKVTGGLLVFGNATAMPAAGSDTTGSGRIASLVLNAQPGSTFTYAGNLGDGAAGMELVKTGTSLAVAAAPGVQVLSGTSLYTGATRINGGILQFAVPSALYAGNVSNWTASNLITGSGGGLALNVGGAGEFTTSDVATIAALGTGTSGFRPGSFIGIDTSNAGGSLTYGSVLANPNGGANSPGLIKLGSGTLTLTASNSYTGITSVAGGVLNFGGAGGIAPASGLRASGSGTLDLTGLAPTSLTVSSLNLAAGGTLALGDKTLTFGNAGSSALAGGVVSGTGTLVYTGTTPLVMSGSNTIPGPMTLAPGAVMFLQNPFTLGGPVAVSGTLNLSTDAGAAMTISGSIFGSGAMVKTGAANLTLSNTSSVNTFSGSFSQLGSGTVNVLAATGLGTGRAVIGSTGPINFTNVTGTVLTSISLAASTGGVTLSNVDGTLRIDAASALSASSTISLPKQGSSSGHLQLNTAGTSTYANAFGGFFSANPPTIGGSPTIQSLQGTNTLTGNLNVASTGGSGIIVQSDSGLLTLTVTISNTAGGSRPLFIGGSGNGVVSGAVTAGGGSSSGINKYGTGTWSLTGTASTFTLTPALLAGVLDVASRADSGLASSLGSGTAFTFSGQGTSGTLRYTGAAAQATNRTIQVESTGGTIDSSGSAPLTFTGTVRAIDTANVSLNFTSGSSAATNTSNVLPGTAVGLTVTSTALPAGTTIVAINGNQYTLSNPALSTAAANAVFSLALERTLRLGGSNAGANTISGPIVNSGSGRLIGIAKSGPGQWILSGTNAYGGTTLGGTGTIGGAVAVKAGGALAPGASIATLTTGSAVSFASGATFAYEYDSNALTADLLQMAGTLSLSGTVALSVADLGPDVPVTAGTVFSMINYDGGLVGGGLFVYGGTSLADGDTLVVGSNTWQIAYSSTTAGVNVTSPLPSGSFVNLISVPEPTTWALLGSTAVIAALLRRRGPGSPRGA